MRIGKKNMKRKALIIFGFNDKLKKIIDMRLYRLVM